MKNNIFQRGSEWRKWDLHVHTPLSIYQNFGVDEDETWQKYINDLENLSNEFAVIGINDYLFIDGYERLKNEQVSNKRLQGLKLLPVVEFRIEKFAGVQFENLKRINLHVIFSDDVPAETIKSQFLNTLEQSYSLESGGDWTRSITYDSVSELGAEIKSGVPSKELSKYGTDLVEGFNNLNVKEDQIFKSLKKDCFKDKHLIAIGKTEWGELKWSDASIATKKSIINKANIVFTAAESSDAYHNAKAQLTKQEVNNLLLDCSDAHFFSDSKEKDRIGNCFTWIKADPTFEGLKQILNEPEGRIFVGDKPEVFDRIAKNRTKYIKELKISAHEGYDNRYGKWFENINIPFNSELVAIIGNKGSGKSALADIIALCSNYQNHEDFSFLKPKKFRDGKHARNFSATLVWESDIEVPKSLDEKATDGEIEDVKYLPQGQFERLTNEINSAEEFQNEIEKVVFDHLDDSEKMGLQSFEELIESKKRIVDNEIDSLLDDLKSLNDQIISLEKKQTKTYKIELENLNKKKQDELKALIEPPIVSNPNDDPVKKKESETLITNINALKKAIEEIEVEKSQQEKEKKQLIIDLETLKNTKKEIELKAQDLNSFIKSKKDFLTPFDLNIEKIFSYKTNFIQLDKIISEKETALLSTKRNLGDVPSEETLKPLPEKLQEKNKALKSEQEKLGSEQKKYQDYLAAKKEWEKRKNLIIGDSQTPGTLEFIKKESKYLENKLGEDLASKFEARRQKVREVFQKKQDVVEIYKKVKERIDGIIDKHTDILQDYTITIAASLVQSHNFQTKFFSYINHVKAGTFYSKDGAEYYLRQLLSGVNFDDEESIISFLDTVIDAFKTDKREKQENAERFIGDQVESISELYSYLFSLEFLEYNYQLKQGGKQLEQLSPGERGALLLVFYLLLDKNDIPLIIDQPEDNLDNHSVANILVPFIRAAKMKRQIIMVTHNPNLAVVADAEQVIYVNLDKENDYSFTSLSGSIEDKKVNAQIVRVLEGAMPAFNKRKFKYFE